MRTGGSAGRRIGSTVILRDGPGNVAAGTRDVDISGMGMVVLGPV